MSVTESNYNVTILYDTPIPYYTCCEFFFMGQLSFHHKKRGRGKRTLKINVYPGQHNLKYATEF